MADIFGTFRVVAKNKTIEKRTTKAGSVLNFTLVDTETRDTEVPVWYKATVWGKLADLLEGNVVHSDCFVITGRAYRTTWTNKEGEEVASDEISVSNIKRVSTLPIRPRDEQGDADMAEVASTTKAAAKAKPSYDEVPF
jgi:single-stranded DNA-binding protein